MVDVDEPYILDKHCMSCNYVHLVDEGVAIPMELYVAEYEGKGRHFTSGTCSFICKLEFLLNALESEDDFNQLMEMDVKKGRK